MSASLKEQTLLKSNSLDSEGRRVAERPREPNFVDLDAFTARNVTVSFKTAEMRDERASRLRREEANDNHQRRITLMVHNFVFAVVAVAFLISWFIVLFKDPKTGLPDKAMGIITAIVAAGVGYITGKASK